MLFASIVLATLALTPIASASAPVRHARRNPAGHSLRALPRHGKRFSRRADGQATVKCLSRYTFALCAGSDCTDMGAVADGTACVGDGIVMDDQSSSSQPTSADSGNAPSSSSSLPSAFQPSAIASAGKVAKITTSLPAATSSPAAAPSATSSPVPSNDTDDEDSDEDDNDEEEDCSDQSDEDNGMSETSPVTSSSASVTASQASSRATAVNANVQYTKHTTSTPQPTTTTTPSQTPAASPTTTTSASSPAATTSAPSSGSGSSFSGKATYYNQDGGTGACGNTFPDSAFIVAMNVAQYGGVGASSQYCGKTVQITNTDNGKSVTCTVQDACPGCAADSLDLSVAAFEAIGSLSTGVLNIKWSVSN